MDARHPFTNAQRSLIFFEHNEVVLHARPPQKGHLRGRLKKDARHSFSELSEYMVRLNTAITNLERELSTLDVKRSSFIRDKQEELRRKAMEEVQ